MAQNPIWARWVIMPHALALSGSHAGYRIYGCLRMDGQCQHAALGCKSMTENCYHRTCAVGWTVPKWAKNNPCGAEKSFSYQMGSLYANVVMLMFTKHQMQLNVHMVIEPNVHQMNHRCQCDSHTKMHQAAEPTKTKNHTLNLSNR